MNTVPREAAPARALEPLPIDGSLGFPQSFTHVFDGATYRFRLYVNLPAESLAGGQEFFELPAAGGHLVARVELDQGQGRSQVLLLSKVVPELVYETGAIALEFPLQRLARANLNGQGEHGTRIEGRIGRRWA